MEGVKHHPLRPRPPGDLLEQRLPDPGQCRLVRRGIGQRRQRGTVRRRRHGPRGQLEQDFARRPAMEREIETAGQPLHARPEETPAPREIGQIGSQCRQLNRQGPAQPVFRRTAEELADIGRDVADPPHCVQGEQGAVILDRA